MTKRNFVCVNSLTRLHSYADCLSRICTGFHVSQKTCLIYVRYFVQVESSNFFFSLHINIYWGYLFELSYQVDSDEYP